MVVLGMTQEEAQEFFRNRLKTAAILGIAGAVLGLTLGVAQWDGLGPVVSGSSFGALLGAFGGWYCFGWLLVFPLFSTGDSSAPAEKQEVHCPSCDKMLRVPSDYSGIAHCPACQHPFGVEAGELPEEE